MRVSTFAHIPGSADQRSVILQLQRLRRHARAGEHRLDVVDEVVAQQLRLDTLMEKKGAGRSPSRLQEASSRAARSRT